MKLFSIIVPFIYSESVLARSLKATADKLGKDMITLGMAVATFAIVVAGIWLMLGKQDAGVKITQAITGLLVITCVVGIKSFIAGVS
jgi:hypothetical protein